MPTELGPVANRGDLSTFDRPETLEEAHDIPQIIQGLDDLYARLATIESRRREPIRGLLAAAGTLLREEMSPPSADAHEQNSGRLEIDPTTRELLSQSLSEFGLRLED